MTTKAKETSHSDLAKALVEAIELTRPTPKKTIANRKKGGAFATKDGSPKPKMRRVMYQHSVRINEDNVTPREIELLNLIKPGSYCDGYVKVIRRKDRGIDIDYPIKTNSQRLRLINDFGIVSLTALLERVIDEAANPRKVENEDVDE